MGPHLLPFFLLLFTVKWIDLLHHVLLPWCLVLPQIKSNTAK
jgi:hypothetical protein